MPATKLDVAISHPGRRIEKVLLVAYYEPRSVPSIAENIEIIKRLSSFHISVLNLAEHRVDTGFLKIPPVVNLNDFDAVIIHNTVSYNVDNLRSLDTALSVKLCKFEGAKLILKQDEHYRFSEFANFASAAGVDCIFSIMPEQEVAKTYGVLLPGSTVRHMLTSYVTASMRRRFNPAADRSIDIGYRGSIMPLSFGRLCYQKRKIGEDVLKRLAGSGLALDISSRWEDRLGGDAWFEFLASCKAVLGVESGSGVFDLDGTLGSYCRAIEEKLGPNDGSSSYAEAYLLELSPLEGRVAYFMISPRHFEAISVGAVQILFPGSYTERMNRGQHYFELAEDYSNLDAAVDLVRDTSRRTKMATAAFEEVLLDERNWIETFVQELDEGLLAVLDAKGRRRKPIFAAQQPSKNVLLLQCHEYGCDPRRDSWYSNGAPKELLIHHIGISNSQPEPILRQGSRKELIVNVSRRPWSLGCLDKYVAQVGACEGAGLALRELYFLAHALALDDAALFQIFGMSQQPTKANNFRWYLSYILSSAVTLVEAIANTEGVHTLVAINFPSLIPALILKGLLGVPVVYEALEYWPEADPDQGEFAIVFWREMERRLVRHADHRGTVSPPLAHLMTEIFEAPFYSVPNCVPLPPVASSQRNVNRADDRVRFLFQGNFAPYRGLEALIQAWAKVDPCAVLIMRGPDNAFRQQMIELARNLGLDELRVSFPSAVLSEDLVSAAQLDGDVGIVPYTATGANYANCSPNKLSQYMSAGLPILANATNFVSDVVRSARCGLVVDFQRELDLVDAVRRFCDDEFRRSTRNNALAYFENSFNWSAVSEPFYSALKRSVANSKAANMRFFLDSCAQQRTPKPTIRPSTLAHLRGHSIARILWRQLPLRVRGRLVEAELVRAIRRRLTS